ncbi:zn-dependent hydrolase oxidoreductase family [Neofusicoccum parvum]|uniref:Zn-dependent hydrolase oxidoreductase family n=2 Tax=Neofusicoccum parvum TaxID=310453 RepID=A0ACB5RSX4_9PEZI|nr:putative zn-dependent hydrolase oxidoreductase family protein [Neofusicoccum parvum UCRNP2]GME23543.1 zn-dependent hydrolase oxidoreductase family [Neofusicoccum parvum]GME63424.1 zn-dependent hydrolase oxidoreductase family [Neofusicoccum parvum]
MSSASTSALLYATTISASQVTGAVPEDAKELAHHAKGGKGFLNPWESYNEMSVPVLLGKMIWRSLSGNANRPNTTPPTVPIRKPQFLPSRDTPQLRTTWLGHACYLVEFPGGLRVLFDPVFEGRCGPMAMLGPKRYNDPPCKIEDIPAIDIVVISHAHYDHLSHPTVTKIKQLHPNVHFFAPLGNKKWFADSGLHNATELDWWQSRDVHLSPVEESKPQVVESGSQVKSAKDILATVECLPCLIPIGAYEPRFIMSPMHANPFDSANIFVDTQCKRALGMHWGTWVLTEEDVLEPPRLLKKALSGKGIPEEGVFDVCDIGESREFS